MTAFRIVIADNVEVPRQVSKVITLSDGGYSVLAPYHAERQGWLAKFSVDYSQSGAIHTPVSEMSHYTADDRVKLSHHWDGFVQFSGEQPGRIVSGRDPLTGQPKGLGILGAPVRVPITTGPTFGLLVWGLQDFKSATESGADVTFTAEDIYYRNCTPVNWNAYVIEGWVFGADMWAGVRGAGDALRLSVGSRNFQGTGANLEFKVLPLDPPSGQSLGLLVARTAVDFPSSSGFVLTSPSDKRRGSSVGTAMMATYPRFETLPVEDVADLTFVPPTP